MEFFSLNFLEVEDKQEIDSLDHYYASILNDCDATALCYEEQESIKFIGDNDEIFCDHKTTAEDICAPDIPKKELHKLFDSLAKEVDYTSISKFNIFRSFLWEGMKRAITRKSFCAKKETTDDIGNS